MTINIHSIFLRYFRLLSGLLLSGLLLSGCASLSDGKPRFVPVEEAISEQNLVLGKPHRDELQSGGVGPDVVLIAAGQFLMGSAEDETGRYSNEGPQHKVIFARPFLLGKTEITLAQFRHFVEAED